jgi:hypothetical protein
VTVDALSMCEICTPFGGDFLKTCISATDDRRKMPPSSTGFKPVEKTSMNGGAVQRQQVPVGSSPSTTAAVRSKRFPSKLQTRAKTQ